MDKIQQSRVRRFVDDDDLFEAVLAGIQEELDKFGPKITGEEDDQTLGQKYRAFTTAKDIVKLSFNNLATLKGQKPSKSNFNIAK